MKTLFAKKPITLAKQGLLLKKYQPFSRLRFRNGSLMIWDGSVQPTAISCVYDVRIIYKLEERPRVKVLHPKLEQRGDEPVPHTFTHNELCLFRFKYFEFGARSWIAETILPWTSLWLYFYEVWQLTGEWLGGGEHPVDDEDKSRDG